MYRVYIFNDWHNGDIITNRCLVKALLNYDVDVALGSHKNRHYLVSDLPVEHVISPWDENAPHSPSLAQLCPPDRLPVNSWCGTFPDIDREGYHNWSTIARTWNRHSESYGIGVTLPYKDAPMIDFWHPCKIKTRGRAVYVENSPIRSNHCYFDFDMARLSETFPDFNFYCTATPKAELPNLIDCSKRSLVEMSFISNGCEAIVGKGSGPFLTTYTEANRSKPRAVVQYCSHPFWHYYGNPLQNLRNEDQLVDFLWKVHDSPWEEI